MTDRAKNMETMAKKPIAVGSRLAPMPTGSNWIKSGHASQSGSWIPNAPPMPNSLVLQGIKCDPTIYRSQRDVAEKIQGSETTNLASDAELEENDSKPDVKALVSLFEKKNLFGGKRYQTFGEI